MTPDAHATEHDLDPLDVADSYALLDDGQILATVEPVDDGDNDVLNAARRRYRRNVRGDTPVRYDR